MFRPLALLILLSAGMPLVGAARPAGAALPPVKISGTVAGYDNSTALIAVNTRLGRRSFLVNSSTLILLNNHSAARSDIATGDETTITYQYETSVAKTIQLFRTANRTGKVGTVSATSLQLKLSQQATMQFQLNTASVVEAEGISLSNRAILTGLRSRVTYEPNSLILLNLRTTTSKTARGRIVTVNGDTDVLSIEGRKDLTFSVDPLATIRRSGLTATLDDLEVDDTVIVAYVKEGTTLRLLAVEATPAAAEGSGN